MITFWQHLYQGSPRVRGRIASDDIPRLHPQGLYPSRRLPSTYFRGPRFTGSAASKPGIPRTSKPSFLRVTRYSIGARQFREVYVQLDLTSDFRPASRAALYLSFLINRGRGAWSHATLGAVLNRLASLASAESAPNVMTSPMLNR